MKRFLSLFVSRLAYYPFWTGFALFMFLWTIASAELACTTPWGIVAIFSSSRLLLFIVLFIIGILVEFSSSFAIHAAARSLGGMSSYKLFCTDHFLATSFAILVLLIWPLWNGAPGLAVALWGGLIFVALRGVYQFDDRQTLFASLLSLPMQIIAFFLIGLLAFEVSGWRHHLWNAWIVKAQKEAIAGKTADAQIYFDKALSLALKGGSSSTEVAQSWYNLGLFQQSLNHYDDAERSMRNAAPILRRLYGLNSRPYWDCLVRLAEIAEATGRYSQAEAIYRDLLGTMQTELGSKHPYEIGYLNALARLAYIQENYSDAEILYNRALVIAESIPTEENHADGSAADTPLSPTDFRVTLVNSLAYTYSAEGKFEELQHLLESHPGFDPPSVYQERLWNQLKKLADSVAAKDRPYAEKLLHRCLVIAGGMGPHDPHNHLTREAIAQLHDK